MEEQNVQAQEPAQVDETVEATTAIDEESTVDATANTDEPHGKPGVQKRIDELTRKRYEAEREREYWREVALRNQQAQAQQMPQQPMPQPQGKPTREQF